MDRPSEQERKKLWQARHDAYFAALALRPGAQGWISDVCVPISRLADCIRETKVDLADTYLKAPLVGHVGDGNFHLIFLVDRDRPEEIAEAERLNDRLVKRAISMGGHQYRRTWDRQRQNPLSRSRIRAGSGRPDAPAQTVDRSKQHHESRQNRDALTSWVSHTAPNESSHPRICTVRRHTRDLVRPVRSRHHPWSS